MALQSTMNRTQLMYLLMIAVFMPLFVVIFRNLEQNTYFPSLFMKVLGARKPPKITTLNGITATEPPASQKSKPEKSGGNRSSIGSEVITRKLYLSYILKGRLGNRPFCYASMLGIAAAQGRILVVPDDFVLNQIFDLKHPVLFMNTSDWPITTEATLGTYDKNLLALPAANLIVDGYFQSYKFFQPIRNQIQREFTFLQHINSAADTLMHEYMNSSREYIVVGVHVRRGDFIIEQHRGYAVPNASYFFNAFRWIKKHISGSNIVFLVVSDDLLWCKLNLIAKDVVILPDSPDDVHLAVLSKCHHVIMSAGTFGWWGGWLAGGHVIYFSRYMEKHTEVGQNFERKYFFPPHWIALDN